MWLLKKSHFWRKWSKFAGYKMSRDPRRSLITHPDAKLFFANLAGKSFSTATAFVNNEDQFGQCFGQVQPQTAYPTVTAAIS
jgi:hypothetical protein